MFPFELYLKIFSHNEPELSLFLVSKYFKEICNIKYAKQIRYYTEKVLLNFSYTHETIFSQFYKFVSWNKYRRYKSRNLNFTYISFHYSSDSGSDSDAITESKIFSTIVCVQRIVNQEVIDFAKKNMKILSPKEFDFELGSERRFKIKEGRLINNRYYFKYLYKLYNKDSNKIQLTEFPHNSLKYVKSGDENLVEKLLKKNYIVTKEILRIAVNNNYEEILNLYRKHLKVRKSKHGDIKKSPHYILKQLIEEIIKNINNEKYDPFNNILNKRYLEIITIICKMKFNPTIDLIKFCLDNNNYSLLEMCYENNKTLFENLLFQIKDDIFEDIDTKSYIFDFLIRFFTPSNKTLQKYIENKNSQFFDKITFDFPNNIFQRIKSNGFETNDDFEWIKSSRNYVKDTLVLHFSKYKINGCKNLIKNEQIINEEIPSIQKVIDDNRDKFDDEILELFEIRKEEVD